MPQNVSVEGEKKPTKKKINLETQNPYAVFFLVKVGKNPHIGQSFLSLDIHSLQVPDKIGCALHITAQILASLTAMVFFSLISTGLRFKKFRMGL